MNNNTNNNEKIYNYDGIETEAESVLVCNATLEINTLMERAERILGELLTKHFEYCGEYINSNSSAQTCFVWSYDAISEHIRAAENIICQACTILDFINGSETWRTKRVKEQYSELIKFQNCSRGV